MSEENSTLVTQSNALVSASYHITVAEKRIILFMLSQIQKDDEDFKPYRMNIKDFIKELGTKAKNEYERAQVATQQLMSRVLQIKQPKGLLQISFLSSAEYEDGKGYVELSFDPKLRPFLLQLKECFTTYDIRNVMSLKSFHSIRIYELLKQFETIGERTISIDDLKYMLSLEEQYSSYNLFKKRVILQAQKDLAENTDLSFEFEEIKTSRRVEKVKFFIKRKQKQLTDSSNQWLVKELVDMGIEKSHALRYVQIKDIEFLKESINYVKKQHKVNKIHTNVGGYLKSIIEKEAAPTSNYEKRLKTETENKNTKQAQEKAHIQSMMMEYQQYRQTKLDDLMGNLTEEEKQSYFDSRNSIEKTLLFDTKGKIKMNIAIRFLKGHLAKQNGLEDTDEAFKLWVKENKNLEIAQQLREGKMEWTVLNLSERPVLV